eukprot:CAMPEP_0196663048 /NCGR_PEP_ID=MMETSP1086-20130531/51216_1 /TAXON_ID=77921 /ORGANISM="Cyanoptyche  gloeocystis , Strain SAG4.97" /LENGTH=485 /DNA_ID=CAMNT_0041998715 /DNA_START=57 /DNA_END=1514 /DNA_ORIENTATION=+
MKEKLLAEGTVSSSDLHADVEIACSKLGGMSVDDKALDVLDVKTNRLVAAERLRAFMALLIIATHVSETFWPDGRGTGFSPNYQGWWWEFFGLTFLSRWPIQMFFVLAGFASFFSLRKRSSSEYLKERTLRLLPPAIFGLAILNQAANYFLVVMDRTSYPYENFGDYYLNFYQDCLSGSSRCAAGQPFGIFAYLLYLYVFSVILCPLFKRWQAVPVPTIEPAQLTLVTLISAVCIVPWIILSLDAICLLIPGYATKFDTNGPWVLLFCMILGFTLAWARDIIRIICQYAWYFLLAGTIFLYTVASFGYGDLANYYTLKSSKTLILVCLASTTFLYAFFGLIMRYALRITGPRLSLFLDYVAENAIAIYTLHQLCQRAVEYTLYYVFASWFPKDSFLRFLVVLVVTFLATVALFEGCFRRVKPMRALVGVRLDESSEVTSTVVTPQLTVKVATSSSAPKVVGDAPSSAPAPSSFVVAHKADKIAPL